MDSVIGWMHQGRDSLFAPKQHHVVRLSAQIVILVCVVL